MKHSIHFIFRLGPVARVRPVVRMVPGPIAHGPVGLNYVRAYIAVRLPGGWRVIG